MSLGEKLRQARLEAGISQRALCADVITRNMLSQIENGSARPSMATLQYLAGQLGKPVSYFLEEMPVPQEQAPLFHLVQGLEQARQLLNAGKSQEAAAALQQAEQHLPEAPDWIRRQSILLKARLNPEQAATLADQLPSLDGELMVRVGAALKANQPQLCIRYLTACENREAAWELAMGEALLLQAQYAEAAHHFHQAESQYPHRTSQTLEICYRELEDYQKAYHYACRVRNLSGR